jgi:CheY-like chemotaxis protein
MFQAFDSVTRESRSLLIIEDDPDLAKILRDAARKRHFKALVTGSGETGLQLTERYAPDGILLATGLPAMDGKTVLFRLKDNLATRHIPVHIVSGSDRTPDLMQMGAVGYLAKPATAQAIDAALTRIEADLPDRQRQMIRRLHDREAILENKQILIVDDDMRNVFSLISILEAKGVLTLVAKNGKEALAQLKEHPEIDLVLMDIMMPEMDGYEAMREVRKPASDVPNHKVTLIALTAKAMKGDRSKCLQAGASDYLSKPVDADRLLSMLRGWLYEAAAEAEASKTPAVPAAAR